MQVLIHSLILPIRGVSGADTCFSIRERGSMMRMYCSLVFNPPEKHETLSIALVIKKSAF